MTQYVIEALEQVSVPVVGTTARFPVQRIYCVGRNYAAHAREMGSDPDKQTPFFFTKPGDAIVSSRRYTVVQPVDSHTAWVKRVSKVCFRRIVQLLNVCPGAFTI